MNVGSNDHILFNIFLPYIYTQYITFNFNIFISQVIHFYFIPKNSHLLWMDFWIGLILMDQIQHRKILRFSTQNSNLPSQSDICSNYGGFSWPNMPHSHIFHNNSWVSQYLHMDIHFKGIDHMDINLLYRVVHFNLQGIPRKCFHI